MTAKSLAVLSIAVLSSIAGAQKWIRPYETGLDAARTMKWGEARAAFQQAIPFRPEDQAAPTILPGPATDRKVWRNGAPYSPNFLAAYSLYRQAIAVADPKESNDELRTAASEFETLVQKDQASAESLFFLEVIYTRLDDATKRQAVVDRTRELGKKADFKVDTEIVAPEEIAAIGARTTGTVATNPVGGNQGGGNQEPGHPIQGPGYTVSGGKVNGQGPTVNLNDYVSPLPSKFALVVGQSETRLPVGAVSFAATDADRVGYALTNYSGYPKDNVLVLKNVSAAEIKAAAQSLAARMDENSSVLIYYAGAGVHLAGKDYLAGKDTEQAGDIASMVAISDLYDPFARKGSRIYAFYEANRPMTDGTCFGQEKPQLGSISQVQATIPGDTVRAVYRNDQTLGVFGNSFVMAMQNIHANRIPIYEFTWSVVQLMRNGGTGTSSGGVGQICTLPQLFRLAQDSKL